MLTQLHIRDLAIVSAQELELQGGLSVLTGETGAGKSILIDALGLALGERADTGMIRAGSERAEIGARFDIRVQPRIREWLGEHALDDDDDCLIRRVLVREGRSKAFVNGRPVALQQLVELGNLLVEIHGQHAHQSLLQRSEQRRLLDAYGGHLELAAVVAERFKQWRDSRQRLQRLQTEAADRLARLDLLRFQRDELTALNLQPDELETLEQDQRRLSHLEQLQVTGGEILQGLDESELAVRDRLVRFADRLETLQALDEQLGEPREMLDNALIQVDEAIASLRNYLSDLELDPAGLQQVEQRLEAIHDLARKYRIGPAELPERLIQIEQELERLEQADVALAELQSRTTGAWEEYRRLALQLSERRHQAGRRLGREISEAMQQLGMPGGVFSVACSALGDDNAGKDGLDQIEFRVSANPGMPQQPLTKVASGGELSRISLAIQVATIRYGTTPTLVFDEVDVGIGGGVAEIVGQMLRRLGATRQILCVTHLPQVAAQAGHHLLVRKTTRKGLTHTRISSLDERQRIEEIARMLGGVEITDQTLAHAREMVSLAAAH